MGTSTSYSSPPDWGQLKGSITRLAGSKSVSTGAAAAVVGSFVEKTGFSGHGGEGGSSGTGGFAAASRVARSFGGFVSDVGKYGLSEALERNGLSDLREKPVQEIILGLVDRLGGPASTIDDVDARMALSKLQEKILEEAENVADVERILSEKATDLGELLADFFGFYLYEHFCRVFYESLVQKVGEIRAESFLDQIKDFIFSSIANQAVSTPLGNVEWGGEQGQKIIEEIMEATMAVFGG
jgi:hypothetical protein